MRVVAGTVKGFELKAPKGAATRPTSDKVRGAIFDILDDSIVEARVADLYAGTGAMAIEALSRGASHAILVESRRDACAVIQTNLRKTGFTDRAVVWCLPVLRALAKLEGRFEVVILDPPYASQEIDDLMTTLGDDSVVADGGLVVLEHGKRFDSSEGYGALKRLERRQYGDTAVSLYEAR